MGVVLNYTTTIDVKRTVAEVQELLGTHGAAAVQVTYEDRQPTGIAFTLTGPHGDRAFTLPIDVEAVHRLLNSREVVQDIRRRLKKDPTKFQTREHAARVAWRTAQDWLEAQLAMVAAQMVALDEIMLPYLHVPDGRTLREAYRANERAALEAGRLT